MIVVIGKYIPRTRLASRILSHHMQCLTVRISKQYLRLQRPPAILTQHVPLTKPKRRNHAIRARPRSIDLRHPPLLDPGIGPRTKIRPRGPRKRPNQITPFRIRISMFPQVNTNAFAKMIFPQIEIQQPQQTRRLLINNRPIGRFRVLQIRNLLIDRRRPVRAVDLISGRLNRFIEPLPHHSRRFHLRLRVIRDVLRKALLQPQVVKPSHRHKVAKPLVRKLVQHRYRAPVVIAHCRHRTKQHRIFIEKCRTRVFHAAIRKAGNQHLIVFRKRKRLGKKCSHARHAFEGGGGHTRPFFTGARDHGTPREQPQRRCILWPAQLLERPGGKRKKIRTDGLRCLEMSVDTSGIRNHCPVRRSRRVQRKTCLQIRLVEARKRLVRIHGNKQRVDIFAAILTVVIARNGAVGFSNARFKIEFDPILTRPQMSARHHDVTVALPQSLRCIVHNKIARLTIPVIQHHRTRRGQREFDTDMPGKRRRFLLQFNPQPIANIGNLKGAISCQIA